MTAGQYTITGRGLPANVRLIKSWERASESYPLNNDSRVIP